MPGALIDLVDGRGPDAVIDAVGMEAHGSPRAASWPRPPSGCCRTSWPEPMTDKAGVDRLAALHAALKAVRRGGTVSISGVYGGEVDPMPMMEMFDRGIQLRMGQCHVKPLDRRHPAAARRRRRPARRRGPARPTGCRWRGAAGVRDVPEEGGRLHQGRARRRDAGSVVGHRRDQRDRPGDGPGVRRRAATAWSSPPAPRSRLDEVREECRAPAPRCSPCRPTSPTPGAVAALADAATGRFGRLDALGAHGRGDGLRRASTRLPAEVFDQVSRTDLLAAAGRRRGWRCGTSGPPAAGTLVLTGSVLGHITAPYMSGYVAGQVGPAGAGPDGAAGGAGQPGVRLCLVNPGSVDTPVYQQAANYLGRVGRPPPPVTTPERVARAIADCVDRPRREVSVGRLNVVMRFGFTVLPGVYDVLVGPLMRLGRADRPAGRRPRRHRLRAEPGRRGGTRRLAARRLAGGPVGGRGDRGGRLGAAAPAALSVRRVRCRPRGAPGG